MLYDIDSLRFRFGPDGRHELAFAHEVKNEDHWSRLTDENFVNLDRSVQPLVNLILPNRPSTKSPSYLTGRFSERNRWNIPGPFYGAATDNCETGPAEAAENVLIDNEGFEFIYRQPDTFDEIQNILCAARCDPFAGYACDGNKHWTPNLVREWWRRRNEVETLIQNHPFGDRHALWRYRRYLNQEAEIDLRHYLYFLEEQREADSDAVLPNL